MTELLMADDVLHDFKIPASAKGFKNAFMSQNFQNELMRVSPLPDRCNVIQNVNTFK